MSRFFDALKEASRSRSKPNESDGGGNWEALVPDATQLLDANELLKEAMASAAAPAPALAPEPEREEPPAALPEELVGPGRATRRTARLRPRFRFLSIQKPD